jgi:dephospho-CoA kinase
MRAKPASFGENPGMSDCIIGVTGGVASGKSEVTRRFEALGVLVADADVAARTAVAPGSPGLAAIVTAFGPSVLTADGGLDRAGMRQRVFGDEAARRHLESIIHPLVRAQLQHQCKAAPGPYAIAAIPLLAEGGGRAAYPWLQRILVVDVAAEIQRARLMQRDGIDATLAERMINAQASRAQRLAIADDVIVNAGGLELLDEQVAALDRRYRALALQAAPA